MARSKEQTLPKVMQSPGKKYTYEDFIAVEEKHETEMKKRQEHLADFMFTEPTNKKAISMARRASQPNTGTYTGAFKFFGHQDTPSLPAIMRKPQPSGQKRTLQKIDRKVVARSPKLKY